MKVCAFLTDGFETVEALGVVDILRRAGIETDTISITGNLFVKSAQNINVEADALFEDYDFKGDEILFLAGGPGHKAYFGCDRLMDMLLDYNKRNIRLAAICAAPSAFGRLGILEGKKAMAFPGYEEELKGAQIVLAPERVVTDGNITTSRGMGTALDLGFELVRLVKGGAEADKLMHSTQYIS